MNETFFEAILPSGQMCSAMWKYKYKYTYQYLVHIEMSVREWSNVSE